MIALLRKQRVYNLFKEYFGEDKVDMQGNKILVWWPELVVSNEFDQSCTIKDLYAKICIHDNGSLIGSFTLNRTSYNYDQWKTGYCHSHVMRIYHNNSDYVKEWKDPCLGSGPIRQTISNLNLEFDEDVWRLFIFELDQYVRHESVEGVPYIRLETIGTDMYNNIPYWNIPTAKITRPSYAGRNDIIICDIIKVLIERIVENSLFRFNYINNCYSIAENPIDIVIKVSNLFIDWYNNIVSKEEQNDIMSVLIRKELFRKCKIVNNRIQLENSRAREVNYNLGLEGTRMFTFKEEEKTLHIYDIRENTEFNENYLQLLHPDIVMYIIHRILRIINYRFNGTNAEKASRAKERVRYF